MKNLFAFLINIALFIAYTIINLFQILWYGKLPKVSIFHQTKSIVNSHDEFNDETIQSKIWPHNSTKIKGADEFISHLLTSNEFMNNLNDISFPIFDGKKIIGEKSIGNLLEEELNKFKKNKNLN